ncbi:MULTISPECIES: sigma factor [unclassified Nocardioides]|uniref:sigma factor n=1 Tax=unclassified Nocardioides TaxID=2615069 RepID=UPI0006F5DCA8|nr:MULTISPECIES: sigma factor [unclassified Nocardioides]KQY56782.1 hypothetical protein ASD30_10750 [Nocardioides sp. Root140]KQZ67022.1 hypothetical protein ASD66_18690 [Nocardioides sp. Root151]KRF12902.1 hypothetical protein ASH02_15400 [Nocardioides sp. Soil796]
MTPTCDLLVRAGSADRAAFAEFYDATCTPAYLLARCLAGDVERAESLLLGAYAAAWRSASRFDPTRERALTWLLSLVQSSARQTHEERP